MTARQYITVLIGLLALILVTISALSKGDRRTTAIGRDVETVDVSRTEDWPTGKMPRSSPGGGDAGPSPILSLERPIHFEEKPAIDLSAYVEDYDALRTMALDGDPWAAYRLATWLRLCDSPSVPRTSDELADTISRYEQTKTLVGRGSDGPQSIYLDPMVGGEDQTEAIAESLEDTFYRCRHTNTAMRREAAHWLEWAIVLEREPLFLIVHADSQDLPTAEALYNEAWSKGASGALLQLHRIYRESYDSGDSPDNKVKAFAYFLAWSEIERQKKIFLGQDPELISNVLRDQVTRQQQQLVEYEATEAIAIARRIIEQSDSCCEIRVPPAG